MSSSKVYGQKQESIVNNSVVSFYDNFGLIFKGSEDNGLKIGHFRVDHPTVN